MASVLGLAPCILSLERRLSANDWLAAAAVRKAVDEDPLGQEMDMQLCMQAWSQDVFQVEDVCPVQPPVVRGPPGILLAPSSIGAPTWHDGMEADQLLWMHQMPQFPSVAARRRGRRNRAKKSGSFQSPDLPSPRPDPGASSSAASTVAPSSDEGMAPASTGVGFQKSTPGVTMMFRNLPEGFTRSELLRLLDGKGFKCSYDFVYLPTNLTSLEHFGYAFVNFVDEDSAAHFQQCFAGFTAWERPSTAKAEVERSEHQGLQDHIQRYRNSPLMHESVPDELRPALFSEGIRMPLPAPTRKVAPPRRRKAFSFEADTGDEERAD